jgi:hypothetical protein
MQVPQEGRWMRFLARQVLEIAERRIAAGGRTFRLLALAVRIAIATIEDRANSSRPSECLDPLFHLRSRQWAYNITPAVAVI